MHAIQLPYMSTELFIFPQIMMFLSFHRLRDPQTNKNEEKVTSEERQPLLT